MSKLDDFFEDRFDQEMRINAIHKEMALMAATELLKASQSNLQLDPELPQSDIVICAHAF